MKTYHDVESFLSTLSKQNQIMNRNMIDLWERIESIEKRIPKISEEDKRTMNKNFMRIISNREKKDSNVIPK